MPVHLWKQLWFRIILMLSAASGLAGMALFRMAPVWGAAAAWGGFLMGVGAAGVAGLIVALGVEVVRAIVSSSQTKF
jgi:hypothetical protein